MQLSPQPVVRLDWTARNLSCMVQSSCNVVFEYNQTGFGPVKIYILTVGVETHE
jgi:hypothetical protein